MTSGFTLLGVDAYIQDIVKRLIIIAAVMADQYRRSGRHSAWRGGRARLARPHPNLFHGKHP